MTDNHQLNPELAASDSTVPPAAVERAGNHTVEIVAESNRRQRRRLIRAAVASVPVVLTFTAGKARAQAGSPLDSGASLQAPDAPLIDPPTNNSLQEPDSGSGALTPAEQLETFGLQRSDRPEGYSTDPFRDLDTVSDPVDLSSP